MRTAFARPTGLLLGAAACAALASPALGRAERYDVRKNDVVAVKFDSELSTDDSRVGDRFWASASDADVFPLGTRFRGKVLKVEQKSRRHPAALVLAFDEVDLPDGVDEPIDGAPIPLDAKYVDRDSAGRYTAKASVNKSSAVGIGALGGLVLGTLLHKPFEGAFVGILAGIAVAETAGNGDASLTIHHGAAAGVLFRRDFSFDERASAAGEGRPELSLGDRKLAYPDGAAPFMQDGVAMAPVKATAAQLGLSYDERGADVFVENADHSARLERDASDYRFDGETASLPCRTATVGGVLFAPVEVFNKLMGRNIDVSMHGTIRDAGT